MEKPQKPTPDFPLFPHDNGQWAKNIKGKLYYFGRWAKPDEALARWESRKDALLGSRELTLYTLCSKYMEAQETKVRTGELAVSSIRAYRSTVNRVKKVIGNKPVACLEPGDFAKLKADLTSTRMAVATGNEIRRCRAIFNWGSEAGLCQIPLYGPDFKPPRKSLVRRQAADKVQPCFEACQVRSLLYAAHGPLNAMILLGINCGFGNKDVSELQSRHLDLDKGIVDFPRPKTGIDRRATLWPETVESLRVAVQIRPKAREEGDEGCVFLTAQRKRWVKESRKGSPADQVGQAFSKILRQLGIHAPGLGFYTLRHTFRTVADEIPDAPAIDRIMGHETPGMSSRYRVWRKDESEDRRLRAVTDHVRKWLYS